MRRLPAAILFLAFAAIGAQGECPEEPLLQNHTDGGSTPCPCFISGEEAGSVLDAPAEHYPIQILRIGIGWASQFGGTPDSFELAVHVYGAGLPDPGAPLFSIDGPVLVDGFINEFDVEVVDWIVESGPFTVTLEFFNDNAGNQFAPSVIYDIDGCQPQKNVVYAIPGGWFDACDLGVPGDWVFHVAYRQVNCASGVEEELIVSSASSGLMAPQPNPFSGQTRIDFDLTRESRVEISVYDALGRRVDLLEKRVLQPGRHRTKWDGTGPDGANLPAGIYFVNLRAGRFTDTRKIVLKR